MREGAPRTVAGAGDVALATLPVSHGEGGPTVIAAHATGFIKELWLPVLSDLAEAVPAFEAICFDHRAHGDSGAPPPPYDWWDLGRDVLAVVGGRSSVIGVGHSCGAAALALAELMAPGTFASLVLIEPIILPPGTEVPPDLPIATTARRRRVRFPSRDAAAAGWQSKEPFSRWDARVFEAYVAHALRQTADGFELKCSPESESAFYLSAFRLDAFATLGRLNLPVVLVAGEETEPHLRGMIDAIGSALPDVVSEVVPGGSHLAPMESPGFVAGLLAPLIAERLRSDHR
ncbi:MAG: alpha/beta fold hydrolase [Acidimicrobiia bacterium]